VRRRAGARVLASSAPAPCDRARRGIAPQLVLERRGHCSRLDPSCAPACREAKNCPGHCGHRHTGRLSRSTRPTGAVEEHLCVLKSPWQSRAGGTAVARACAADSRARPTRSATGENTREARPRARDPRADSSSERGRPREPGWARPRRAHSATASLRAGPVLPGLQSRQIAVPTFIAGHLREQLGPARAASRRARVAIVPVPPLGWGRSATACRQSTASPRGIERRRRRPRRFGGALAP
jgi:hypothetical protein